ncbi:hypothetical protein BBP40_002025 [Aspergillus hancockii]|nr:hypothetical protein BBP40_002025 [Aspergillus hancockii]
MRPKANSHSTQDQRPQQQQQQQQQQSEQDSSKQDEDIPACQSCRKKKARCSREQPCSQCVRFGVTCVYDDRRLKPGLRAGAVDQLYRRIETLENMFLGQSMLWKQMWESLHPNSVFPDVLDGDGDGVEPTSTRLLGTREHMKQSMLQLADSKDIGEAQFGPQANDTSDVHPPKRRRVDAQSTPEGPLRDRTHLDVIGSDLIHDLVEFYFANIHHWVPVLHVRKFRDQIKTQEGRQKAVHILHAIVALCSRFSADGRFGSEIEKAEMAEKSRQKVILSSIETFSVANLQALVIIAFDTRIHWLERALWEQENEVRAPYFGISDTRAASPHRPLLAETRMTNDPDEQDCIGGFAYCIEATESLALVTNFFLHHALDIRDANKAQLWLMRFKELDLRMVQWKLFLPPKWRDASVLNAHGIMDPNLTLAHTTHNTAVILLHQGIAYPPLHWQSCPVKLPSASSAETCLEAASEISTIGRQFLLCSPIQTNPQFSFCLFIAGRMLLTHSKYYGTPIPPSLDSLIASLFEMSRRWSGPENMHDRQKDNLASGFAKRLVQARDNVPTSSKVSLDIRQTVYSENSDDKGISRAIDLTLMPTVHDRLDTLPGNIYGEQGFPLLIPDNHSDTSVGLAFPPLPLSFQQTLQSFNDIDSFDMALTDRDQFPSQVSPSSRGNSSSLWNCDTAPLYNSVPGAFVGASPGQMQATLSPGQRISRYGPTGVAATVVRESAHLDPTSQ